MSQSRRRPPTRRPRSWLRLLVVVVFLLLFVVAPSLAGVFSGLGGSPAPSATPGAPAPR